MCRKACTECVCIKRWGRRWKTKICAVERRERKAEHITENGVRGAVTCVPLQYTWLLSCSAAITTLLRPCKTTVAWGFAVSEEVIGKAICMYTQPTRRAGLMCFLLLPCTRCQDAHFMLGSFTISHIPSLLDFFCFLIYNFL